MFCGLPHSVTGGISSCHYSAGHCPYSVHHHGVHMMWHCLVNSEIELLQNTRNPPFESTDFFANAEPCTALHDIITITPEPNSRLGNFTQEPAEELFHKCSSSSVFLPDGPHLADALLAPTPLVKVLLPSPPVLGVLHQQLLVCYLQ